MDNIPVNSAQTANLSQLDPVQMSIKFFTQNQKMIWSPLISRHQLLETVLKILNLLNYMG